jgi:hypothetical protein
VDYTCLYADFDEANEAYYLAAVLNSNPLDVLLRPFRRKEQGGHPHIMKKVWEFPIPSFNPELADHQQLASLGRACRDVVDAFLDGEGQGQSIASLRRKVRERLQSQIAEIDELASRIL